jgi:hypothetical protein
MHKNPPHSCLSTAHFGHIKSGLGTRAPGATSVPQSPASPINDGLYHWEAPRSRRGQLRPSRHESELMPFLPVPNPHPRLPRRFREHRC